MQLLLNYIFLPRGYNLAWWFKSQSLGGDNRDRTDDPLLAKQVLSQLSYTPVSITFKKVRNEPQKLNNDSNLGPQRYFYRSDLGMLEQSISFVQVSIERR